MADNNFDKYRETVQELKSAIERNDEAATKRLNDAVSDMEGKMRDMERAANRPTTTISESKEEAEYKAAFSSYLRTGDKNALREFKAMSASVGSEGQYTVPKLIDDQIRKLVVDVSPMRSIADVRQVSTTDFHMPFSTGGTNSVWVGEKDARNPTNTDALTDIVPTFGELYAKPLVTQTLLEDSQFDIEAFVAAQVAREFARAEGAAFINGDGNKKPTGLLNVTTAATADNARAFGTVQYVPTGAANGFAANSGTVSSSDVLVSLTMAPKAAYRTNSGFIMNKATLGVVRTFKNNQGDYIWQPSVQLGVPSTLLGYPVWEAEDMPNIAANAFPIAFGDFKQGYLIADRIGMSVTVDPYTQQPYVAYGTRKRVGGTPVNTEAYKLLKVAAS